MGSIHESYETCTAEPVIGFHCCQPVNTLHPLVWTYKKRIGCSPSSICTRFFLLLSFFHTLSSSSTWRTLATLQQLFFPSAFSSLLLSQQFQQQLCCLQVAFLAPQLCQPSSEMNMNESMNALLGETTVFHGVAQKEIVNQKPCI